MSDTSFTSMDLIPLFFLGIAALTGIASAIALAIQMVSRDTRKMMFYAMILLLASMGLFVGSRVFFP